MDVSYVFAFCIERNGEEGNAVCIFQISGLYVDLYKSLRKYEIPNKSQQDAQQCNAQFLDCLICFLFTLDVIGLCSEIQISTDVPCCIQRRFGFTRVHLCCFRWDALPMAFYAFFCSDREEMDALLPWA